MRFFNLLFELIVFDLILTVTSAPNNTSSHHHAASTIHLPPEQPVHASMHTIQIITHPTYTFPAGTIIPAPLHTRPPHSSAHPSPQPQQSGQKPIFVVFEVLGGLVASGLLLGLLRCCYRYKKPPPRDRIAEVVDRHILERELVERERNEPAPPYVPACLSPPPYSSLTTTGLHETGYTDLDTHNLPSSSIPLPQSSILIPPRPAG